MKNVIILSAILLVTSCAVLKKRSTASGSSSQSVLYIGDSQSAGPLGEIVYRHLQQNFSDDQISLYGVGGSSPRHWVSLASSQEFGHYRNWLCSGQRTARVGLTNRVSAQESVCRGPSNDSVFAYLNRAKPDYVVFQFLGNSMRMSEVSIVNRVQALLAQLDEEQKCLWITSPPYYRDPEGVFLERNTLRAATEEIFVRAIGDKCEVFRGMEDDNWESFATNYNYYYRVGTNGRVFGDGMHFNRRGAQAFYETFKHKLP